MLIVHRPSDFIVNEVDSNGKVVRLTNFDLPIDPNKKAQEELASIDSLEENVKKLFLLTFFLTLEGILLLIFFIENQVEKFNW